MFGQTTVPVAGPSGEEEARRRLVAAMEPREMPVVSSANTPLDRYARQMRYPPIGESGQRRLLASRVLICGCGALGSVLANTLARAGVVG